MDEGDYEEALNNKNVSKSGGFMQPAAAAAENLVRRRRTARKLSDKQQERTKRLSSVQGGAIGGGNSSNITHTDKLAPSSTAGVNPSHLLLGELSFVSPTASL